MPQVECAQLRGYTNFVLKPRAGSYSVWCNIFGPRRGRTLEQPHAYLMATRNSNMLTISLPAAYNTWKSPHKMDLNSPHNWPHTSSRGTKMRHGATKAPLTETFNDVILKRLPLELSYWWQCNGLPNRDLKSQSFGANGSRAVGYTDKFLP